MLDLNMPRLQRNTDPPNPAPGGGTPPVPGPAAQQPLNSQVDPAVFGESPSAAGPSTPNTNPPAKPAPGKTDVEIKGNMHISRIAAMNGYGNYETLWNENAALKAKRKNAHQLFHGDKKVPQGDIIKLTKQPEKTEPAQTEQVNKFKVDTSQLFLRLKILDDNLQPVGNWPYELKVGGKVFKGKIGNGFGTIADGLIQEDIPKTSMLGTLTITLPDAAPPATPAAPAPSAPGTPPAKPKAQPQPDQIKFTLHIGRLDPIQEKAPDDNCFAGVQARLNNLGFDCGIVDGLDGTGTRNAIKRFQKRMKLTPEDGKPSAAVQKALFDLHDTAKPGPISSVVPAAGETAAPNDQTV